MKLKGTQLTLEMTRVMRFSRPTSDTFMATWVRIYPKPDSVNVSLDKWDYYVLQERQRTISEVSRISMKRGLAQTPAQDHKSISAKNGVGVLRWSAVSLKNIRMRFARVVATYTTRRLSLY